MGQCLLFGQIQVVLDDAGIVTVMKLNFYSETSPSGNTVALAKAISEATGLGATESMRCAMGLFGCQYTADNPLELTGVGGETIDALRETCGQCGISVKEEIL